METKELRELNGQELRQKLSEARRQLLILRFQRAQQQLKNPLSLRTTHREVARILTILREKGERAS